MVLIYWTIVVILVEVLNFPEFITITKHWLNINELAFAKNYATPNLFNRSNLSLGGTVIRSTKNNFSAVIIYGI